MAGSLTVRQARLVLPDRVVTGDLVIEDGVISEIGPRVPRNVGLQIDGRGLVALPGLVDTHVEADDGRGLAALALEAVEGGVTTVLAAGGAAAFREGLAAAPDLQVNLGLYLRADAERPPGAERARGLYVPGALLSGPDADALFASAEKILVVDNADPARIAERARLYADAPTPADHGRIHDVDSAVAATARALELAQKHGRPVHLLHPSTAEEVALLGTRPPSVTAAARTTNLFLDDGDVARLGTRAVAVPPLRPVRHREALWDALRAGVVECVASGHRAVPAADKDRPYPATPPGVPAVALTLPLLLEAVAEGRCTLPDVARWTGEGPARALRLPRKGRLEVGYDGDLALVDPAVVRAVGAGPAGWSPWSGRELRGWPVATIVLGEPAFRAGEVDWSVRGRPL